jgi:hypothetical protein
VFLATLPAANISVVGHLSARDWEEVQSRLRLAIEVS